VSLSLAGFFAVNPASLAESPAAKNRTPLRERDTPTPPHGTAFQLPKVSSFR
jgi:hypothetical protein